MRIFLSHASEDKPAAESIAFSLRNRGHKVFLDRDDLPPGESYDKQIELAVKQSDVFIFVVSPLSVAKGRYTLTELSFARRKWPDPHGRVLPVMAVPTPMGDVPSYLKAVTVLEPLGNLTAETAAVIDDLGRFDKAKSVATRFAAYGAAAGALASFMPYSQPSLIGFRVFGLAPDIGLVFGAFLVFAARHVLKITDWKQLATIFCVVLGVWLVTPRLLTFFPNSIIEAGALSSDFDSIAWRTGSEAEQAATDSSDADTPQRYADERLNKIKATLENSESLTKSLNRGWEVTVYALLGALFNCAIAVLVGRLLGYDMSAMDFAVLIALGLLAGFIWQMTTFAVGGLDNKGSWLLVEGAGEGNDKFIIWSSPVLLFVFTQWLALSASAIGFWLGRHAR